MKKLALLIILLGGVILSSCHDAYVPAVHTVRFDAAGGIMDGDGTVEVLEGDAVGKPDDPVRTGYSFEGWFLEGDAAPYDFSSPVISDITLIAHWVSNPVPVHSVRFILEGETIPDRTIEDGAYIEEAPQFEGETGKSLHWYTDQEYSDEVVFPYEVKDDVIFYGRWETATYPLKVRIGNMKDIAGFKLVIDNAETAINATGNEYTAPEEYEHGSRISIFAYIDTENISVLPDGTIAYTGKGYHGDPVYAVKHEVESFGGDEIVLNMVQVTSDIALHYLRLTEEDIGPDTVVRITISGLAVRKNLLTPENEMMETEPLEFTMKDIAPDALDIPIMAIGFASDITYSVEVTGAASDNEDYYNVSDEQMFPLSNYKPVDITNKESSPGVIADPGWGSAEIVGF